MGVLRVRTPWTRQPQYPVGIDWSNPIAAKASAFALPVSGNVICYGRKVKNIAYISAAGIGVIPGPHGKGVSDGGTRTTSYIGLNTIPNDTTSSWEEPTTKATWMAVCVRIGSATGNAPLFGNMCASTAPYSAWSIVDAAGSGTVRVECSAGNSYRSLDIPSGFTGKQQVIVGRYDGAKLECFINGAKQASSTACSGNITYPGDVSRRAVIGNFPEYSAQSRSFNGYVYLVGLWPVALSDSEIAVISANPWQVFAP